MRARSLRAAVWGFATVVATATAFGVWLWASLVAPRTAAAVDFEVTPGESVAAILDDLATRGLAPSPLAGRVYLAVRADGRSPRFGHYHIEAGTRPWQVLEAVLEGRVATFEVTLIEGSSTADIATVLAGAGIGSEADWLASLADPSPVSDLAPLATSLEGFVFPDTYRFAIGISPDRVRDHVVARFRAVWVEVVSTEPEPWGSVLDVVTLASLVEAETSIPAERARIAGVFVNRLDRGMLLQCDPTVVYALKRHGRWTGRLLRVHWQLDDPYNTYRYPGLPPGPINSPGRAALVAALAPERHGYLYFVAKPDGGHSFSRTLREHNEAVSRWQRSRR